MTGPYDSVIGVEKEPVLQRFLTGMRTRFKALSHWNPLFHPFESFAL